MRIYIFPNEFPDLCQHELAFISEKIQSDTKRKYKFLKIVFLNETFHQS